jgi:hypothetical protein
MSLDIFCRAAGEVLWRSHYYRISYVRSDIAARNKAMMGL